MKNVFTLLSILLILCPAAATLAQEALLYGNRNISLQMNGSASRPTYTLENNSVGNMGLDVTARNLRPAVANIDGGGQPDLLTVNDSGALRIYRNFIKDLNAKTSLTAGTKLLVQ